MLKQGAVYDKQSESAIVGHNRCGCCGGGGCGVGGCACMYNYPGWWYVPVCCACIKMCVVSVCTNIQGGGTYLYVVPV